MYGAMIKAAKSVMSSKKKKDNGGKIDWQGVMAKSSKEGTEKAIEKEKKKKRKKALKSLSEVTFSIPSLGKYSESSHQFSPSSTKISKFR